ncbi:MAG: MoxR family ATPase [Planctomycetes bacterium]|nr:MoxR family ATPase [Planctomycetota bacterium]
MTVQQADSLEARMDEFRSRFGDLKAEIQKAIVGHEQLINDTLIAIFSQGHVLLEGVPGLGKTYLVNVISSVLGLTSGRVQCTPDLMPADILGTHIVSEDASGRRSFRFEKGPVFKHLLLVDEINRSTPKTQAALLEVMQERGVTAGGERFTLPEPFFVLATQNPLEMEGTYPLPEAQLDRFFFKLRVSFPNAEELVEISNRTTRFEQPELRRILTGEDIQEFQKILTHVPIADPLTHYAARIILATHSENDGVPAGVKRFVSYGASPRGMQALVRGAKVRCLLDGRSAVSIEDIQSIAKEALRHRIILNFEGDAENIDVDNLIEDIIKTVPTPAKGAA